MKGSWKRHLYVLHRFQLGAVEAVSAYACHPTLGLLPILVITWNRAWPGAAGPVRGCALGWPSLPSAEIVV